MKKIGFTLAEVLITLGIIGVVAALTIIVIIPTIDEQQTRSAFLKQASLLQQVAKQYMNDNGISSFLGEFTGRTMCTTNLLIPYYKTLKDCKVAADTSCFNNPEQNLNSTSSWNPDVGVVTQDGAFIIIDNAWSDCDTDHNPANGVDGECGRGFIDINGTKGPNRLGYDVFPFYIMLNNIVFNYPTNLSNASTYNSTCIKPPDAGWNGWQNIAAGCGARMLQGLPRWE